MNIHSGPLKQALLGLIPNLRAFAVSLCGDVEREVRGPEGETYRFVREQDVAPLAPHRDRPIRLSHVVLNAKDVDASERFASLQPKDV